MDKDALIRVLLRKLGGRAVVSPRELIEERMNVRQGAAVEIWQEQDPPRVTYVLKPPEVQLDGECRVVG